MPLTRTLQEVVLAVHFAGPIPLTVTDVAAWINEYGGVEPRYQQLPVLGPSQLPMPGQQFFQIAAQDVSDVPRIRLFGSTPQTLYIFQNDRIAFGWQRDVSVGEEVEYPGYDVLRAAWIQEIERFNIWLEKTLSITVYPKLVEISYNNAYPIDLDGKKRRMSEIFKLLDAEYRPVNAFQVSWAEFIGDGSEGVVNAQGGLATAPPGQRVFALNYFALGSVRQLEDRSRFAENVMETADKLHERILDMHLAAVIGS